MADGGDTKATKPTKNTQNSGVFVAFVRFVGFVAPPSGLISERAPPCTESRLKIGAMHSSDLILTITGGLAAALLFGYVTRRIDLGILPVAATAFIEDIMGHLGATAEQIDRERARAHEELFGRA